MAPGPQFRTGSEEAEKASARIQFLRTGYLKIEDGENATVRLMVDHDRLITVMQHNNPPTRTMPQGYEGKWPQSMPCVCRRDVAFRDMYEDCFNCNQFAETGNKRAYKPSVRSWGLAVMRKKLMKDGRHIGFEDETVEIKIDDVVSKIPKIVTVNYAWGNFWAGLSAFKETRGTWLDVDYHIKRTGKELESTYSFATYPSVDVNGLAIKDGAGEVLDIRNYEHAKKYIQAIGLDPAKFDNSADAFFDALGTLVGDRASDEFYARFFDTRVAQPAATQAHVPEGEHDKPADNEPDEEALNALKSRVQGHPTEEPATLGFG
jgi:hypothetical protein